MSGNGNPPEYRQVPFVPSGLAIREPPPSSQYPPSPANDSFPHHSHPFDNPHIHRHQTNLNAHHLVERQSQSLRSAESGSLEGSESQETQREKQRLVQGWAFNSQPPSLGEVQGGRRSGPPAEIGARQYVEHPRMMLVARPGMAPYPAFYGPVPGPSHQAYQIHQPIHPYYQHQQHQQHPFHPHYPPPNGHQSPSDPSNARNCSPHQPMQEHRFHPLDPNHPMNRDLREGYNRMGSPMAIGNLVGEYSDPNRRSSSSARMAQSPRREDPRASMRASGSGTMMAGLAAGMESPEQSMRSSRGDRESHGDHHHQSYASTSQRPPLDYVAGLPGTRGDGSDSYSGLYANSRPIPLQGRQDNPSLHRDNDMLYRTEGHAVAQRPQHLESQTARSSVIPGTPSERFEDSMDTSHDGQDEPLDSPSRDYGRRSLDTTAGGRREGLALNGLVSAERFSTVPHGAPKISPHRQRSSPFGTSPSRSQRPTGLQLSPDNESMSLEATQRDEALVRSPTKIVTPNRHAQHSKSPPKAISHPTSPRLPRPALTSGPINDPEDDTFIGVDDRKVALQKRSNVEIDNHMNGLAGIANIETNSPTKRKKAGSNENGTSKAGVLSSGDLAEKKTPGRGELHNRKPLAIVSMPKTDPTTSKPTKSPSKKQKTSHPSIPAETPAEEDGPPPVRKDLFLSVDSSDTLPSEVSDPSSRRIAPYRRLGKTSAAGSTVSLYGTTVPAAVSLEGIEAFENRGEVVIPAERDSDNLEARQDTAAVEVIEDKQPEASDPYLNSPTRKGKGKRGSDASLTPISSSEEDEPTVHSLVMPSPSRSNKKPVKTCKSPSRQKRRRSSSKSGSVVAEVEGNDSDAENLQRNTKSAKRQGRTARKIMSPTMSPVPVRRPVKPVTPSQSTTDSLSDVPTEEPEEWDALPLPLLKDDPRDQDFRPAGHSQAQGSPHRKIGTRRESTTNLPAHRAKRVFARWDGSFYPGNLIGKNKKKYAGLFDDGEDFKLGIEDLRQCIFHKGDSISIAKQTTPKLPVSGSLEVMGTVDPNVDITEPLMPEDKLVVRANNGKDYEIAVKYCIFEDDQEDVLDNREFDEAILDIICGTSTPDGDIPKKSTRAGKAVAVEKPRKELRSALQKPLRSESRSDRVKPLYDFAFVISAIHVSDTSEKKALKAKIVGAGGRVMDDFYEFYPKCKGERFGSNDIALAKHYHNLNGIFLLVLPPKEHKSPFLTEKYMMALALGIPCLSATYIDELLDPDETVTWHSFLLSAGVSHQLKGEVSQIVDPRTGEGPEHLIKKIDCETVVRRPFNGRSFLIATGVKHLQDVMRYICSMMGASLVLVAESKSRTRKAASVTPDVVSEIPSDQTSTDVDYIIVSDVTTEDKIDKNLAGKTCNVEWVKQCLIMGKLYPPSLMQKEKLVIKTEGD
ncbi:hypothetical protein QFC22_006071 [Naganishia vaughanmartiniae]|uniref:Uncharacterized protein n=1 Tax=Naganishia vaughanmartiniae TaxID=1424756 RepID=A0ACC2WQA7_9TREE|nr:hypothetical protein QFC22_006071 [Naganishia vaughanmartiniae]